MFIRVKVFPAAKREEIIQKNGNSFEIFVKEKAKHGKANQRVLKILADYFQCSSSKITVLKGMKDRNKIFKLGK